MNNMDNEFNKSVKRNEDPLQSLYDTVVFHSHDWGVHKRDVWLYGIIVGWDDDSLEEFKIKFRWSEEAIKRLKRLHKRFKKLKKESSEEFIKNLKVNNND
jgi:hypothetical protein